MQHHSHVKSLAAALVVVFSLTAVAGHTWRVSNVSELVTAIEEINDMVSGEGHDYQSGYPHRIELEPGTYDLSEVSMSDHSHLYFKSSYNLTIVGLGNGPGDTVLVGGGAAKGKRVIYSEGGSNYGFSIYTNFTVTGGYAFGNGGAICTGNSRAQYLGLIVTNNTAVVPQGADSRWSGCGGGCANGTAIGCSFADNKAATAGGGFYTGGKHSFGYEPYVADCVFSNNQQTTGYGAYYGGGALCSYGTVSNCIFIANRGVYGGAFGFTDTTGKSQGLYNCAFTNNTSTYDGGAVFKATIVSGCTFSGNTARYGGAIDLADVVEDSVFEGNSSAYGGAIYGYQAASCVLDGCTFITNTASTQGGAVYDCTAMTNCVFVGNRTTSNNGGAVCLSTTTPNQGVVDCAFTNNVCGSQVGGALSGTVPLISGCDFYANTNLFNNSNYGDGGAIYLGSANTSVLITNCTFGLNFCYGHGSDIRNAASGTRVIDSKFHGSTAAASGAGVAVETKDFGSETYHPVAFTNCYFTGLTRGSYAVGRRCEFYNCRFSGIDMNCYMTYDCNLYNCIVENCTAGGANCHIDGSSDSSLYKSVNTIYSGNHNTTYLHTVNNKTLVNCTIVSNVCDSCRYGGIIRNCPMINCLLQGNYQAGWIDIKYKYTDSVVEQYLTNCVYMTDCGYLKDHLDHSAGCRKATRAIRFVGGETTPYAIARDPFVINRAYQDENILSLVVDKDVYGQKRFARDHDVVAGDRLDIGAAECQLPPSGLKFIVR